MGLRPRPPRSVGSRRRCSSSGRHLAGDCQELGGPKFCWVNRAAGHQISRWGSEITAGGEEFLTRALGVEAIYGAIAGGISCLPASGVLSGRSSTRELGVLRELCSAVGLTVCPGVQLLLLGLSIGPLLFRYLFGCHLSLVHLCLCSFVICSFAVCWLLVVLV